MCSSAFQHFLGVHKSTYTKLTKAVQGGASAPPPDKRCWNRRDPCARSPVDAYLFFVYENEAEVLADMDDRDDAMDIEAGDVDPPKTEGLKESEKTGGLKEADVGVDMVCLRLAEDAKKDLPTKWIAHVERQELYERYCFWHLSNCEGAAASMTTFRRVSIEWKGILKIRAPRQHAQCHECARLSALRCKAETDAEKNDLQEAREEHLKAIFADRSTDDKANAMARLSARPGSNISSARVLKIDLDGMDQSKFRIPRNVSASKALEKCFRPQMHLVGVVVHGITEIYFGFDADVPKDSNTQRSILSRALELADEKLADKGMSIPPDLILHAPPQLKCTTRSHSSHAC
jgi:hypothetical protein